MKGMQETLVRIRKFQIDQGSVGLGSRDYYLNATQYKKQLSAYRKYMFNKARLVAEDSGMTIDEQSLNAQIDDVMAFETQLAKVLTCIPFNTQVTTVTHRM